MTEEKAEQSIRNTTKNPTLSEEILDNLGKDRAKRANDKPSEPRTNTTPTKSEPRRTTRASTKLKSLPCNPTQNDAAEAKEETMMDDDKPSTPQIDAAKESKRKKVKKGDKLDQPQTKGAKKSANTKRDSKPVAAGA